MAYDLEEQDQLDELKSWWRQHGSRTLTIVIVLLASYVGYQTWQGYQSKQAIVASEKYTQLGATDAKDTKAVQALSAELIEKYPGTPYAGRAALLVARSNLEANDTKSAQAQLEWAAKNATEDAVKAMANLQLAALQLGEKQYDLALTTLDTNKHAGFEGLVADLKGDVLAAQGKTADAKKAYEEALKSFETTSKYATYTRHKLEALGG